MFKSWWFMDASESDKCIPNGTILLSIEEKKKKRQQNQKFLFSLLFHWLQNCIQNLTSSTHLSLSAPDRLSPLISMSYKSIAVSKEAVQTFLLPYHIILDQAFLITMVIKATKYILSIIILMLCITMWQNKINHERNCHFSRRVTTQSKADSPARLVS